MAIFKSRAGTNNFKKMNNQNKSFAKATKINSNSYPNRNQAIVLNTNPDFEINEYIYAIGSIVNPKNITHVFKTYNGRLCIYLTSKDLVEQLVLNHKYVKIQDTQTEIRRYINPAQRIIISHVCPSIPDDSIEEALKYYNVKLASPITMLRMGIKNDDYSHIFSDRRQVFVLPEEVTKIPNSVIINHEETNFRIFFAPDATCYKCKKHGHIASKCTEIIESSQNNINTATNTNQETTITQNDNTTSNTRETTTLNDQPKNQNPQSIISILEPETEMETEISTNENKNNENNTQSQQLTQNTKRNAASLSSLEEVFGQTEEGETSTSQPEKTELDANKRNNKKTKSKRTRSLSPEDSMYISVEALQSIKEEIEDNQDMYPVSYNTLLDFTQKIKGCTSLLKLVREYTDDSTGFLLMLKDLYTFVDDRSTKSKFTRITNRLKEEINNDNSIINK